MDVLSLVIENIREKGLVRTMVVIAANIRDLVFDIESGTKTTRWEELGELEVIGENKSHGERYQPTKANALRKLFRAMELPSDGVFVDLGCGKGRVLMIAAEYGFGHLVGVDFSKSLCDVAERNLHAHMLKSSRSYEYEILNTDVVEYQFGPDTRVIFLFNPFDKFMMQKVVENIEKARSTFSKDFFIIYNNPVHGEVFEASPNFKLIRRYNFSESEFCVYQSPARQ